MDQMITTFVGAIHRYAKDQRLDLVHLAKDQRKNDIAKVYLSDRIGSEGIWFVGWPRRRPACSAPRSAATPSLARPARGRWPTPP
jgi:hypothetical protein